MDLLIRGGLVVDGTADAEPVAADLAIDGGRITAIEPPGGLDPTTATTTIDATGRVVAPGFIDPHSHVETAILAGSDDALAPARMGVTTILTAPDGFGWAPLEPAATRDLWAATAGIYGSLPERLDGRTIAGYLDGFAGISPVNVLPQAPGQAIRYAAMGWAAGPADPAGLDRMRGLIGEWLDAGAAGLAIGLDYEPGGRAAEDELTALAEVVAARGGSLAAHIRYEDLGRPAGYAELGRIGARTGVRVTLAHERLDGDGAAALDALDGVADVAIESYLAGPSSTQLTICLPAHLRSGGPPALADRLATAAGRAEVAAALRERLAFDRAAGDRIVFAASADRSRVGREIADAAAAAGADLGAYAASVLAHDPGALFVYHHDGRPDLEAVFARTLRHPRTLVASDGIYVPGRMHPRGFGTFPRVLGRFVREQRIVSLGRAIHAMTGRTAERYRVPDRGTIAVGRAADLVVFDPATIADGSTFDEPRQAPAGIGQVLVNGVTVVDAGRVTASRPGRVLAAAWSVGPTREGSPGPVNPDGARSAY